jgi:hypothetical protein
VGFGASALSAVTSGTLNTAIGLDGLISNTTGSGNVGAGTFALYANSGGNYNTAVGLAALEQNTNGISNTAVGKHTLDSNTMGSWNTAAGAEALFSDTTGGSNVALGVSAGYSTTNGSSNVYIGSNAGYNATTGSNNIYVGANTLGVGGETNTITIGNGQTKTVVAGIRGVTTLNADAIPVVIDSTGQLGTVSSSQRFKEDIRDMNDASRRLFELRPVTFRYAKPYANGVKPIQFGLVAEEVAQAFPELAVRGADGSVETVHYETLNVLLLNEIQRQQRDMDALRGRIAELERVTSEHRPSHRVRAIHTRQN